MVSRPIQTLLSGLVDYAGLFPPAGLAMGPAVAEYARQRAGEFAWMLGRFIVPAGRLDELASALQEHAPMDSPWPLSVLVGEDAAAARAAIDGFEASWSTLAEVEAIETKAPGGAFAERAELFEGLEVFFELPADTDPRPAMESLVALAGEETDPPRRLRAKIRTGSVDPDAIPSIAEVARFIEAAAATGIGWKATAGLHHPVRSVHPTTYEDDSPRAAMHGFLNVFLAGALAHGMASRERVSRRDLAELLAEGAASTFEFSPGGVSWRDHRVAASDLALARSDFARSFGSCSFQEPVDDLKALHLL